MNAPLAHVFERRFEVGFEVGIAIHHHLGTQDNHAVLDCRLQEIARGDADCAASGIFFRSTPGARIA